MAKKATKKTEATQTARAKLAKPAQTTPPLWLRVSSRVQIQDVRLIDCSCHIEPEAIGGKKTYQVEQQPTAVRLSEKSGHIVVIPTFGLKAQQEGDPDKTVISIKASFLLAYKVDSLEGLDEEAFQQFADVNGTYNAWPYWRELVQSITSRMGIPPLVIEVHRLGAQLSRKPSKKAAPASRKNPTDKSSAAT